MRARGAVFGLALLLIVMAVVLYLSAENWRAVAPQVQELGASEALPGDEGKLPGLSEMQAETDAHAQELEDALAASE